jgi:hypothetical protein
VHARVLLSLAVVASALSTAACSSLTKPDEILIYAEPPAPPKPAAPPAAHAGAQPGHAGQAGPPGSGG